MQDSSPTLKMAVAIHAEICDEPQALHLAQGGRCVKAAEAAYGTTLARPEFVEEHQLVVINAWNSRGPTPVLSALAPLNEYATPHRAVDALEDAEATISWTGERVETGDWDVDAPVHRPMLDIDFPAALVPSSTPGHFHLYLDKPMPAKKYFDLLVALAEAGIIEEGFANASIERGYTSLRLPWVKKPPVENTDVYGLASSF